MDSTYWFIWTDGRGTALAPLTIWDRPSWWIDRDREDNWMARRRGKTFWRSLSKLAAVIRSHTRSNSNSFEEGNNCNLIVLCSASFPKIEEKSTPSPHSLRAMARIRASLPIWMKRSGLGIGQRPSSDTVLIFSVEASVMGEWMNARVRKSSVREKVPVKFVQFVNPTDQEPHLERFLIYQEPEVGFFFSFFCDFFTLIAFPGWKIVFVE